MRRLSFGYTAGWGNKALGDVSVIEVDPSETLPLDSVLGHAHPVRAVLKGAGDAFAGAPRVFLVTAELELPGVTAVDRFDHCDESVLDVVAKVFLGPAALGESPHRGRAVS